MSTWFGKPLFNTWYTLMTNSKKVKYAAEVRPLSKLWKMRNNFRRWSSSAVEALEILLRRLKGFRSWCSIDTKHLDVAFVTLTSTFAAPFSLVLAKSSNPANCISQPVCRLGAAPSDRTEAPGATKLPRTVAEKQSQLPATYGSQEKSNFTPENLKGQITAQNNPKYRLRTHKWPIFGRFRPFSAPQNQTPKSFDPNGHFLQKTFFSTSRCVFPLF